MTVYLYHSGKKKILVHVTHAFLVLFWPHVIENWGVTSFKILVFIYAM